ncbi:unnamed protein product, partial [Didymodactylos carnosus]
MGETGIAVFRVHVNIDNYNVGQLPEDDVPVSLLQTSIATSDDDEESDSVPLFGSAVVDTDGTNMSEKDINGHILKLTSKFNKQSLNDPQTCTTNNQYYIRRRSKPVNKYYSPNLLM